MTPFLKVFLGLLFGALLEGLVIVTTTVIKPLAPWSVLTRTVVAAMTIAVAAVVWRRPKMHWYALGVTIVSSAFLLLHLLVFVTVVLTGDLMRP